MERDDRGREGESRDRRGRLGGGVEVRGAKTGDGGGGSGGTGFKDEA